MVENPAEEPRGAQPEGATPAPFDDAPHDPAALKGCSRPILIGCAATVLIGALLFLLLIVKAKDLFLWAYEVNARQILANLPPDVTAEDEERLRRALDAASQAVTEGRIDMSGLQDLQRALGLASKREVSRQDVLEAIEALERLAATPAPADSPAPQRGPPIDATTT